MSKREYYILESNQDNEGFRNNIKGNQYQEMRKNFEKHQAQRRLLFGHRPKIVHIIWTIFEYIPRQFMVSWICLGEDPTLKLGLQYS